MSRRLKDRKTRSRLIKAINDHADTDWTDSETDVKRALALGIVDLHSSVTPMLVLTLLFGVTVVAQIFGLPLIDIPTADWYRNFASYEFVLPPAFGLLLFGYMIYSYLHNMQRRAQVIFWLLVGVWTFLLFLLWIWIWIEMFWYCPTNTPTYCTDGITSGLDTGYLICAISTLVQMPILLIILIYYYRKLALWRAIYDASDYDARDLGPLIYKSAAYEHRFTISVGSGMDPFVAAFGQQVGAPETPTPTGSRQTFRELLDSMLAAAKAEHATQPTSDAFNTGIHDLHGFVLPIIIISLLYGLSLFVQVFALPLIPMKQSQWYSIPATYEFVLLPAIGTLAFGYIIYAYGHSMKRWAYAIHGILIGVLWVLPLSLLVVWFMFEYWWYCPTYTPFYCTNGMTADLALGYEIFVWVTFIQMLILWVELILFAIAARMWRRLYTLTAFRLTLLDEMLYNEPEFRPYLVTIGKKQA